MNIAQAYPSVGDLARRAKARIPHFAWEYLDSGTGLDVSAERNLRALQAIEMWSGINAGTIAPVTETELFGQSYAQPFGVAPLGLSGLLWPGAARFLAAAANAARVPFCLSTFATEGLEEVRRAMGEYGWFQLYPPRDPDVREDLLARAKANNYKVLVVTVDVPVASSRERQRKAGVSVPYSGGLLWFQAALRPAWSLATLREGPPAFRIVEPYLGGKGAVRTQEWNRKMNELVPEWEYMKTLRDLWKGPLVIKGVLRPEDAERALAIGFDGIGVSNHGGRQFDAAPAAIECLPAVKAVVGTRAKIVFDSGLRSGLDILRALALGADFCLLGRAFYYGVGALGEAGAAHTVKLLADDLKNNMLQMGLVRLADLPSRLVRPPRLTPA
jgi:L-lactate dehydrogenase (cytochrome)